MGKKFGFSFSWRRASGLSGAKGRLSRKIGVPLTRSGRERKIGRFFWRRSPLWRRVVRGGSGNSGSSGDGGDGGGCCGCLVVLLLLAVVIGIFAPAFHGASTPTPIVVADAENSEASSTNRVAPSPPSATATPRRRPTDFERQVAESEKRAVKQHPELAREGSVENLRFVSTFGLWQKRDDPRLTKPDWPEQLAVECAQQPKTRQ